MMRLQGPAGAEHQRRWFSSAGYIGLLLVIAVFIWWSLPTGILHPSIGPLVKIEDLAAVRRGDGTYIYPILIRNTGDQPVQNREALFYQLISTKRLSPAQEDYIYVSRIGKAFTSPGQEENYRRRTSAETPDDLPPGESAELINTNFYLSQTDIDKFGRGDLFIYNFLIMRYEDPEAIKTGRIVYIEHCAIMSNMGTTSCSSHNASNFRPP